MSEAMRLHAPAAVAYGRPHNRLPEVVVELLSAQQIVPGFESLPHVSVDNPQSDSQGVSAQRMGKEGWKEGSP